MIILWHNEIDHQTLTANSEDQDFPAENLQDTELAVTWRSLALSDIEIKIDAGAGNTITADYVAILAHNITSGATIKYQMHGTDSWAAPDLDETLSYRDTAIIGSFTSISKRYARFYITDAANPDTYLEIGRAFIGTKLTMPGIEPGSEIPLIDTSSRSRVNGVTYGDEGLKYYAPSFEFPLITQDERGDIEEMFGEVGTIKPVVLIVWPNSLDVFDVLYCTLAGSPRFRKKSGAGVSFSMKIDFEEEF